MREGSVAVVFGTRPEVVKLAPVVWALGPAARTIHTGQHYDPALAGTSSPSSGSQPPGPAARRRRRAARRADRAAPTALLDARSREPRPDLVVVQGDTNSTARRRARRQRARHPARARRGRAAQLRPRRCPRSTTGSSPTISPTCAAPRPRPAGAHLAAEGIDGDAVVVTGNTVVDAASRMLPGRDATGRAARAARPRARRLRALHVPPAGERRRRRTCSRVILDRARRAPAPGPAPAAPPQPRPGHAGAGLDLARRGPDRRARSATGSSSGSHASARSSSPTPAACRRRPAS